MALRTHITINAILPETRVKLSILRGTLHKTYSKLLEEMTDILWEEHKDEVTNSISPHKIDDVFALALKVSEQKAPYNSEGRKLRRKNVRKQDLDSHRRNWLIRARIHRLAPRDTPAPQHPHLEPGRGQA